MMATTRICGRSGHCTNWTSRRGDIPHTLRNRELHSAWQLRWPRTGGFFRAGIDVANTDHCRVWENAQVTVYRRYPAPAPLAVERTLRTSFIRSLHPFHIDAVQLPEPAT